MREPDKSGNTEGTGTAESLEAISIVQRGNLKTLESTLRKHWRMGQNIVLCWSADERGLLVIFVPHYFLGNYCASQGESTERGRDNEAFIRGLISGQRRKSREELFTVSERLDVSPTFIRLSTALAEDQRVLGAVEQLIKRYGIGYVESRAVLLFDIVEFSLYTPFEQASQLNSLSYSLNSAYNKLLARGIEINFARTTTGDGYYIWNRDLGPGANQDLFYFMLLVVADNAVARAASRGNTVPEVRTGYHIGGHYELYQAEGVNPSVLSYIVGDVTIELARMVGAARAHQIVIGEFSCEQVSRDKDAGASISAVSTPAYVSACNRDLSAVLGTQLSGKRIDSMSCRLTDDTQEDSNAGPRRFRIVDKHGLVRHVFNLQLKMELEGDSLSLGLDASELQAAESEREEQPEAPAEAQVSNPEEPVSKPPARPVEPATTEALIDDLASMLKKRSAKTMKED